MFSWFGFSDPKREEEQVQYNYAKEKSTMITQKVAPTVKATSVNVIIDDIINNTNNNNVIINSNDPIYSEPERIITTNEPLRSASISLSIELAKKTSMSSINSKSKPIPFMQKPDTIITPHSSLPKSMAIQKHRQGRPPSSIASNSSNSLLQRMAHSPKASAAAFPTSVSANGNVVYDYYYSKQQQQLDQQEQQHEDGLIRSAAVESLTKRIEVFTPTSSPADGSDIEDDDDDINHRTPTTASMNTTDGEIEDYDNHQKHTITTDDKNDNQLDNEQQTTEETIKSIEAQVSSTLSTCENKISVEQQQKGGGFWSWLGFSSSSSEIEAGILIKETRGAENDEQNSQNSCSKEENINLSTTTNNTTMTTTTTITTTTTTTTTTLPELSLLQQEPSSTSTVVETKSWTSFLFPSKPAITKEPQQQQQQIPPKPLSITKHDSSIDVTSIDESTTTKPIMKKINKVIQEETIDQNLRKVKSTSSLPAPVADITSTNNNNKKINSPATQSLRLSVSTSSFHPRRKNIVLPPFDSQFIATDQQSEIVSPTASSGNSTSGGNILTKAIDAINSILIQPPPDQQTQSEDTTSNWLSKRMRAKFASFVEDMKSSDPKTIIDKRIVVVGVHGWFPMKLVRSMIGEPTGTSLKFCEQMASGVKLYFQTEHGVTLPNDAITLVPLEGEGKVEDRVNQLYCKLIDNSNWLEAVSSADVVLWATHSQGTPVSIMLLKKLLERGHIHIIRQSVCLLAMAGISHGPFPALKGSLIVKYFEADAARELFEFMDSNSPISTKFRQSLAYVLKCGLKVVLTGSMQDQVVPLYSAIMSSVNHPSILRSIYIDGHIYSQDDFLINLIVFALRLRNTGLPDYDLLVHLSEVLAGSLYALEGGHSTIYEELEVYMTAVRYTFETAPFGKYIRAFPSSKNVEAINKRKATPPISRKTSVSASSLLMTAMTNAATSTPPAEIEDAKMESFQAKQQLNPFYLPWAMHGICSDPLILADEELKKDLTKLLSLFEQWSPTSSRLRELKFRLDPLRTIKLSS